MTSNLLPPQPQVSVDTSVPLHRQKHTANDRLSCLKDANRMATWTSRLDFHPEDSYAMRVRVGGIVVEAEVYV